MKTKFIILAVMSGMFLAGCIDDIGNYDYTNAEVIIPIVESNLEEHYDVITLEQLVLEPEIKGDESQYDYLWYAYSSSMSSLPIDTLGFDKKLDYNVILNPGTYKLVFKATDKQNLTSTYQKTELTVSSPFGLGFFVNKYENDYTDVDFIDRDGVVNSNIFQTINGEGLKGQPVNSSFFSVGYSYQVEDEDGNITQYSDEPGYIVCSDNGFKIYHGETMEELNNFETAFMELPEVKKPQGVVAASIGYGMINNNSVHLYGTSGNNIGKFGYPYPDNNYNLSKYLVNGTTSFLTFDNHSGSFLAYSSSKNEPIVFDNYKDYELLYLAAQPYYMYISYYSYALLKHKTEDKALIIKITTPYLASSYFLSTEYQVPTSIDLPNAKVFAISGANTVMYYSNGDNKVNYYNYGNQTEQNTLTLPEDEEVVYMKNVYDLMYGPNIFLVLTEKDGSWKLRVYNFEGATPDLELPAVETYSGSGVPSSVVYRDGNTYISY
ncbi:hypothetical protein J1N10_20110 [Carboxylicivirga sp. A043]|uniref:PKD-like family lipoprotein n=1 Tax=Carboxylicivirga litoralis TaxID=2816963 RepID=UPI0021CB838D|nr:PKD-like family lipoprotein [Carboxylicivirga sp. A043]MCU4158289.1 hypothetical protein [Carboxylicivirga sp. A043]